MDETLSTKKSRNWHSKLFFGTQWSIVAAIYCLKYKEYACWHVQGYIILLIAIEKMAMDPWKYEIAYISDFAFYECFNQLNSLTTNRNP